MNIRIPILCGALLTTMVSFGVNGDTTEIETNFGTAVPTPEQLIEALAPDVRPKTRGIVLKGEPTKEVTSPATASVSESASNTTTTSAQTTVAANDAQPQSVSTSAEKPAPSPAPAKPSAKPLKVATMQIQFAFDSDTLTRSAVKQLHILGIALKSQRLAGGTFLLEGHTDAIGAAGYNQRLSERRSMAIKTHLVKHYRISSAQLLTVGMGETSLLNTNEPEASENRRVRIVSLGHVRN